ncbi:MAG: hypothetical protein ACTSQV_02505 [Alphaproteobacteria bacterium]
MELGNVSCFAAGVAHRDLTAFNHEAARSNLLDLEFAQGIGDPAGSQILMKAGIATLVQANRQSAHFP